MKKKTVDKSPEPPHKPVILGNVRGIGGLAKESLEQALRALHWEECQASTLVQASVIAVCDAIAAHGMPEGCEIDLFNRLRADLRVKTDEENAIEQLIFQIERDARREAKQEAHHE